MMANPKRNTAPQISDEGGLDRIELDLISAAYAGRNRDVWAAIKEGAPVDTKEMGTGLTALHIAAGTNNLFLAVRLVEQFEASFLQDGFGRFPSTVAVECGVNEKLIDYIADAEAEYLKEHGFLD